MPPLSSGRLLLEMDAAVGLIKEVNQASDSGPCPSMLVADMARWVHEDMVAVEEEAASMGRGWFAWFH